MSDQTFMALMVGLSSLGAADSWRGAVFAVVLTVVVFRLAGA
jgi:hypothetical protein